MELLPILSYSVPFPSGFARGGFSMKRFALSFVLAAFVCASMSAQAADETEFTFQTVVFPSDTFTQLLGINLFSKIAGYHGATVNKGFVLTLPSTFTSENFPGSAQTQVVGINTINQTAGFISTPVESTTASWTRAGLSAPSIFQGPPSTNCSA
jgi:hypothetical protein